MRRQSRFCRDDKFIENAKTSSSKFENMKNNGGFVELVRMAVARRHFLFASIFLGIAIGVALALMLPNKYTSKMEVRLSSVSTYGPIINSVSSLNRKENANDPFGDDLIYNALAKSMYDLDNFKNAYTKAFGEKESADYVNLFAKIVKYRELNAQKGNEKAHIAGFAVDLTLDSAKSARQLTDLYSSEIENSVKNLIVQELNEMIKIESSFNALDLNVAKSKFQMDSEIDAQNIQEAISISRIGGIAKPIIPSDIPMSAQIPIEKAVPRYFFGYEILEREKELVELNAGNEKLVPDFTTMKARENKLKGLSELFLRSDLHFVDVRTLPLIEPRYGMFFRIAMAVGVAVLFFVAAVSWVVMAGLFRQMNLSPTTR